VRRRSSDAAREREMESREFLGSLPKRNSGCGKNAKEDFKSGVSNFKVESPASLGKPEI